jgi:hypothetical protein
MTSAPSTCRRGLLLLSSTALLGLAACTSGPAGAADEAAAGTSAGTSAGASAGASARASEEASGEASATPAVGTVTDDGDPLATDGPRPDDTDVVLSYAVWDEAAGAVVAGGYVSPVVEDGGTCSLEVSRDGNVVRATTEGIADATTTVCDGLALPGDELRPGTWSVVLRYESDTASGESEPLEVEVPE